MDWHKNTFKSTDKNKFMKIEARINHAEINDDLLSIIVPVYNTENYLLDTLKSLERCDCNLYEVVIVNDGSTDGSAKKIENWLNSTKIRATYISQENSGLSLARKAGIQNSSGSHIAFCDSDDILDIESLLLTLSLMIRNDVDMGIFRSCVFSNASGLSHDFYDAEIWCKILEGKNHIITTHLQEPRLFRLEPNANTRIFKREFFESKKLYFPAGIHFEDLSTHIESIAAAKSILCINRTGYYYRVDRPGKITDQKSEKRFDILKAAAISLDKIKESSMSIEGKAWALLLLSRMIYWCGENTLNKDRLRFFKDACALISQRVEAPVISLATKNFGTLREAALLMALSAGASSFLNKHASKKSHSITDVMPFISPRIDVRTKARVLKAVVKQKLKNLLY